eukprot:8967994-Karenia_brevis.AAC.1
MEIKRARIGQDKPKKEPRDPNPMEDLSAVAGRGGSAGAVLGGSRNLGNLVWRVPELTPDHALPH